MTRLEIQDAGRKIVVDLDPSDRGAVRIDTGALLEPLSISNEAARILGQALIALANEKEDRS